ncbi:hypothetical protein T265_15803, partial [Opisthorchis viverrini]
FVEADKSVEDCSNCGKRRRKSVIEEKHIVTGPKVTFQEKQKWSYTLVLLSLVFPMPEVITYQLLYDLRRITRPHCQRGNILEWCGQCHKTGDLSGKSGISGNHSPMSDGTNMYIENSAMKKSADDGVDRSLGVSCWPKETALAM